VGDGESGGVSQLCGVAGHRERGGTTGAAAWAGGRCGAGVRHVDGAARGRQRREGENEGRRSRAGCLKYVIFGGQGSAAKNNTLLFGGCVRDRRK
jgi:hypothetical protein